MTMNDFIADRSALSRNIARGLSSFLTTGLFLSSLTGCAAGGGAEEPAMSISAGPTAASVSLAWDPVQHSTLYAYHFHYVWKTIARPVRLVRL
jgi:hypothetical protein